MVQVPVPKFDPFQQFTSLREIHCELMAETNHSQSLIDARDSLFYTPMPDVPQLDRADYGKQATLSAAERREILFRMRASTEFGKRLNHCAQLKLAIQESGSWDADMVIITYSAH